MSGSRFLVILLAVAGAALIAGCGGNAVSSGPRGDAPSEAQTDQFREAQAALVNETSLEQGRRLAQTLERRRQVQDGLVRGALDLSRSTISYYAANPEQAAAEIGTLDLGDEPLEIVDYGPSGSLPIENATPRIYVMFSQPMVPLSALGEVIVDSPLLTVEPEVEGVYRWYGTKTLSFEPGVPLTDSPRYEITVSGDARSLGENELGDDFSFSIFSERLELVNTYAGSPSDPWTDRYDVPLDYARTIVVEFNQTVEPDILGPSIIVQVGGKSVELGSGEGAGFELDRPDYPDDLASRTDRALRITLAELPPERTSIRIAVDAGARPQEGSPETESTQGTMIRTISEFQATQLSSYSGSFPMDNRPFSYPVYLEFSHPVAEGAEEADYVVTLDGERIEPTRTEHLYRSMGFSIANARPGQIVAVTVPPAVTDIHGRELGREAHLQYTIPRPDPRIEFPSSGQDVRHLEAEFDPAIVFNMRNIVDFRLGIDAASRFFGEPSFPSPTEFDTSMHTPDYVSFHEIDLIPYLNDQRRGTVLFSWRAEKDPELVSNERYSTESDTVAVQVTDFGISTRFAYNKVLVWVNRLSDGSPVAEAEVTAFNLRGTELSGITDADGLAVLPIPDNRFAASFYTTYNTYEDDLHIRARKDGDTAELRVHPTQSPYRFGVYSNQSPTSALVERNRVHLFTDRGLYQPGEEFAFRGIHWLQNANGFVPFRGTYTASIESVQEGREVWRDTGRASESGGFSGILRLPDDLEIGNYVLRYRYGSGSGGYTDVSFRVGSFRRLAFEVTSRTDADHILAGESASVGITASYLAGGAAAGADYDSFWSRKPVRYVPPGSEWEDWIVGTNEWGSVRRLSSGEGTLSGAGTASVSVSTAEHELEAKTYRYTLEVRVEDVDRQEVAHATSVLVHPADHYVAARFVQGSSDGWWSRFVPTGDEIVAEARLVGIEGDPVDLDGVIRYGLVKGEWRSAQQQGLYGRLNRRWEYVEETLYEEEGRVNDGSFRYSFSVDDPGRYTLFFVSTDEMGRETRTEIPFYATGSGWVQTASQTPQDIDMVVDKSVYEPGETARILVQSPLPEGRYLLTIEREGIISERVVELSGSNEVIEVPVRDEYVPIFYVALTSYTERTETEDDYFEPDLGKPRGLFGITSVSVATTPVELNVELTTDSESYGPGDEGDVAVRVTHNGRPVANAEVTVLGVDRGVLDLIDYHVPNPLNYFYRETHFPLGVQGDDSRRLLLRPVTYDISTLQGGDAGKLDERKDFSPLALFEPAVATDADGYARLTFDYPDNLTTYRFTAIALSGNRLGLEEHEVIVQNPINVRTALPRRFRNRDTAAAGVVLTNTTGVEQEVSVTAESDVLAIADEPTKSITIPPNSVYELPFVLEALEPGEGVVRFTTRSAVLNEVLEEEVTVERPLVTEVFSTTGIVENVEEGADGHAVEGFVIPSAIVQSYGSLTVGLDTSIRAYMMPSVERLEAPVGSAWSDVQALYDLSVRAQGYRPLENATRILSRLAEHQFPNGGIGYRPPSVRYASPNPFLSLLTEHVLRQADAAGVAIDHGIDRSGLTVYLRSRLDEARDEGQTGFVQAWTAWLLASAEATNAGELSFLRDAEDELGVAGNALLAEAYLELGENRTARRVYKRCKNFVVIGTQTVDVLDAYETRGYFDSGEMELALMLRAGTLLNDADDLVLRMARSLDQSRTNRRFHSSHDDFWIVHGFAPLVAKEVEATAVDAVVNLGEHTLIDRRLDAQGTETAVEEFPLFGSPLSELPRDRLTELEFLRHGEGQLYYTNTLRYALPSETAIPRDEGIEVRAQIETLDGEVIEDDVLPLGETLRFRVFLCATRRLSYLNLRVPLPSGAEILDPTLATTGSYAESGGLQGESWTRETVYEDTVTATAEGYVSYGRDSWWFWFYRPIQRIYDNAMLYTWEDFYAGDREVSFLIRTTTPGVYPTPPVEASLEFEPEIFGRSGGTLFIIRQE